MRSPAHLVLFILIYLITSIKVFAQDFIEEKGYIANPLSVKGGIIYTDNFGSAIHLEKDGISRQIISSAGCGNYYSVSPDKNFIGIKLIDAGGLQAPAVIDVSTGEIKKLHESSRLCGQVSFTDDGRLGFTVDKQFYLFGNSSLEKYDLGLYANIAPVSPDGNYVACHDLNDQLWVLDLRSGTKSMITDNAKGYMQPAWSPDGRMILYSSLDNFINVYDLNKNASYHIGSGSNPKWADSRHGRIIFYRKEIKDLKLINSDLFMADFDGSNIVRLTDTPSEMEMDPSFSAGGSEIIYHTLGKKELRIAALAADGENNSSRLIPGKTIPVTFEIKPYEIRSSLKKVTTLDMPYVHQAYDTPDYFNGSSACGATSAIMVIAYYNLLPEWDILCTSRKPDHISHWGRYICDEYTFREMVYYYSASAGSTIGKGGYGYMWSGGSSPQSTIADYYLKHGIKSERTYSPPLSAALSEINNGYPYTICVGLTSAGHIVDAHGVGDKPGTLIYNDPWGNKNSGSYPSANGKNVAYDWPGFNNGNQSLQTVYWAVTCRASTGTPADTLVDDLQFKNGFYLHTKPPASMGLWRDRNQGHGGHFWYTYTTSSLSADTCYAEWHPNLLQAGRYEVFAYIPYGYATDARYKIYHKFGSSVVSVNTKPLKNTWVSLGTYTFDKGQAGYVRLGDGSSARGEAIVFDAVKWSFIDSQISGVDAEALPGKYSLSQNYPNPFNPSALISFELPENNFVSLKVYDILGNEVETLVNSVMPQGRHCVRFPSGQGGVNLKSGVYFYRLNAGSFSETRKMVYCK